jgi:hypothetical protein
LGGVNDMSFEDDEQKKAFEQADKVKLRIPFHKLYFIVLYILLMGIVVYVT